MTNETRFISLWLPCSDRRVLFSLYLCDSYFTELVLVFILRRCVPNGIHRRHDESVVPNQSAQNELLQRALRNEGFWRVQLMDTSGPHDPLRWFFAWGRHLRMMTQKGCLVPYTLQPFEALTPKVNPLKGLGRRDELRGLHSCGFPDQISCAAGLNSRINRGRGRLLWCSLNGSARSNNILFPTSIQNSISVLYSNRPQVQPALRTVMHALHAWTVLSASQVYLRDLCLQQVHNVSERAVPVVNIRPSDRRQVVDQWQSRIRMEQSVDILSFKDVQLGFVYILLRNFKWQVLYIFMYFLCDTFTEK